MPLTSEITAYDACWPGQYDRAAAALNAVFGAACLSLHHVGSTAVAGLSAKPEIDILAVVSTSESLAVWARALRRLGYRRGGDLSHGHHFFKRDHGGVRTHKLHICRVGHPMIMRMLALRDHLRTHAGDRAAYDALKRRLAQENRFGIAEYLNAKAPFLDALYDRIQVTASRDPVARKE
ncbi:MAG: GrpB family protein [Pseudomonadota bacterium]